MNEDYEGLCELLKRGVIDFATFEKLAKKTQVELRE